MEKIERKAPKRLLINISEEIHMEIKKHSIFKNVSMTRWVTQAIIKRISEENNQK